MKGNAVKDSESAQPAELRRRAEEHLRASEAAHRAEVTSVADARALVHELQVHQIELEMQNEELRRARMEAEEAKEKYLDLFDFAPAGHFVWDREGRILELNLAGAALLGLDRSAAMQKRFGQFVAAKFRSVFSEFVARVLATDAKQTCEVVMEREGSSVWGLVEGIAAQDRQGPERFCRATVIDISAQKRADELAAANQALEAEMAVRKQAQERMRESEEKYRTLFDAMTEGFGLHEIIVDADGKPCDWRFLELNTAWEQQTGMARAEVVGKTMRQVWPNLDACWVEKYGKVALSGEPLRSEGYNPHLQGWYEILAYRTKPNHFAVLFTDITERKRAQEALEWERRILQAVMDGARNSHLAYLGPGFQLCAGE
ncbi:MAG: PAS domain S-box protein [Verrucomicrobiia bacterium]